jgi:hypothetical protein
MKAGEVNRGWGCTNRKNRVPMMAPDARHDGSNGWRVGNITESG